MSDDRSSYVYVLLRRNTEPFYIGKGKGYRWSEHERCRGKNKHLNNIIRAEGGVVPKLKIREGLADAEACAVEVALIAAIGRIANGGPLVNQTDGGDGVVGFRQTPQQIAKLSAARKGRIVSAETRLKIAVASRGRKVRPETREKLRIANLGKRGAKHSDEFKQKIRMVHTGRKKSPEECARLSFAKRGHTVSEEARNKIRAKMLGRPLSPEVRAKISASLKAIKGREALEQAKATIAA